MKIKRFRAENFRNIAFCDIEFSDGVNLLSGLNAQGKTNAIEGIYVFSRGKSFRATDERDMIRLGTEGFRIMIEYESIEGEGTLEYACFGRERMRKKNGYKISRVSEMIGSFRSVLFYPDNLELVKGGPEERRAFLNIAVNQCYPAYLGYYSKYKTALENRNRLLKMASRGLEVDAAEIDAWSLSMAEYASYIYILRYEYIKKLELYSKKIMTDISSEKENLSLFYKSDIDYSSVMGEKKGYVSLVETEIDRERVRDLYVEIFKRSLDKEKIVGNSLYGPHRDDIVIDINGNPARSFASQGQQRSIVLAIKLGEGEVIKEIYNEYPVFLFDDVLSELDERRRRYVIEGMKERQIIITSCEGDEIEAHASSVIEVEGGEYVSSHR